MTPSSHLPITTSHTSAQCAARFAPRSDLGRCLPAARGAMDSVGGGGGGAEDVYSCGYFRLYRDGRAERARAACHTAPAGFDAETGVTSKDVVIDAATGVAARLYLPSVRQVAATVKLPVLVFYHGGYFVVGSPSHPLFHRYVNSLAAAARVVAVSVRYRLAPEHPLPAAYDDSWAALTWVASGADPWLTDHGDLGRLFLSGVSAGANIAHNMAGARPRRDPAPPVVCRRAEGGRRGRGVLASEQGQVGGDLPRRERRARRPEDQPDGGRRAEPGQAGWREAAGRDENGSDTDIYH
ncbi:hypothetical protein PVAP13_2KG350300 [Panicum virgatum]|uniref:Alpha/beta hydrolase fold-3 domain-containing protein n=1 Tax=Panicum virgatum TaxID=38727 RepID=A0A8T0WD80_PANVG|nr:hypothetical protein PVAP13_2KG350300 [Panicum virgatum]